MIVESIRRTVWEDDYQNPLERLYALWPKISESAELGAFPHLVGRVSEKGLEIDVVLFDGKKNLVFDDADGMEFVIPIDPAEGVEGAYLRFIRALGMKP